jgi:hypothetical protein
VLQGSVAQTAAAPGIAALFSAPGSCTLQFAGAGAFATGQLHLLRPDGSLVCSSRAETGRDDFAGAPWLSAASKGPVLLAPAEDPTTGEHVVLSAAPVAGRGIAVGAYDLASLGPGLAARFGGPREPEILVTSADGATILARSIDPQRWVGERVAGTPFALGEGAGERSDVEGASRLYGTAEVDGAGWRVHAGQDEAAALSAASSAFNEQLAIILAGLLLMLAAALVLHRQVTRPIALLGRRVRAAAGGGASEPVPCPGRRRSPGWRRTSTR